MLIYGNSKRIFTFMKNRTSFKDNYHIDNFNFQPSVAFALRRPLRPSKLASRGSRLDLCDYYAKIGRLDEHPECLRAIEATKTTTPRPTPSTCSINAALVQCTSDSMSCPKSGQICTQSDGSECCQDVTVGKYS